MRGKHFDSVEKGDTGSPTRSRDLIYKQREAGLSAIIEENEDESTDDGIAPQLSGHTLHGNPIERRGHPASTQYKDPHLHTVDRAVVRWMRFRNPNDPRVQELSIPMERRPVNNWRKLPYEFRCRDQAIPRPGKGPDNAFWFAETDTMYVPASMGGPADIPMSREGMKYFIPIEEYKIPLMSLGKFWEIRKKTLEELRTTGKLADRDVDRWGRPWGEIHAFLGKEPRKYGKKDHITVFELGSGGQSKILKPWWEYKYSMLVVDACQGD